jgi:hypothetical protein
VSLVKMTLDLYPAPKDYSAIERHKSETLARYLLTIMCTLCCFSIQVSESVVCYSVINLCRRNIKKPRKERHGSILRYVVLKGVSSQIQSANVGVLSRLLCYPKPAVIKHNSDLDKCKALR